MPAEGLGLDLGALRFDPLTRWQDGTALTDS